MGDPDRQWFCSQTALAVTNADRALAILGYNRNGEFHSTVSGVPRVTNTTPASPTAKVELKAHAVRQIDELMNAASTRYRAFVGASSCLPFPAFTNATDKATAMQTQAKAARHFVSSIGACMPSMLHGAAAAADDDDNDDGGSGGGKLSKTAKKKAAQALTDAQQANRDAKRSKAQGGGGGGGGGSAGGGGRGGGGGVGTPGDFAGRVKIAVTSLRSIGRRSPARTAGTRPTGSSTSAASRKSSLPPASRASPIASFASRSSSCVHCRRPSPTTTSGWRTPTASETSRATRTTTQSQPARTSNCLGSTAPCCPGMNRLD